MANEKKTGNTVEVWLRGPVAEVPELLQPAAHVFLQAAEEIEWIMSDFPNNLLWERPAGAASVAFHLQHIPGVLDRLFTYARGSQLVDRQLKYLSEEGLENEALTTLSLVQFAVESLQNAVKQLSGFDASRLTELREVGRRKLPSTALGLIFHSAEHTMRHVGQLLVTARVVANRQ